MLELDGAYAVFANGGSRVVPHVISRIKSGDGHTLYSRSGDGFGQVATFQTIGTMNRISAGRANSAYGKMRAKPTRPASAAEPVRSRTSRV